MSKTVLAVDVGSATITAAVAGGDNDEPQVLQPQNADTWPAAVYVAADGRLITDESAHDQAASVITRFTRLLGQEAKVISGECRHADSLVAAALSPVLAAATHTMRENVELVVATYPSTWPEPIVAAYRHAIAEFAPATSLLVPWADAATAATFPPNPFVDCPITSVDFGARSASVTMARVDQQGKAKNEYSITNPAGGFATIVRPIIAEIAQSLRSEVPGEYDDEAWWDQAVAAFGSARQNPSAASTAPETVTDGSMIVDFPEPLGLLNLNYREVSDLIVEQMTEPQGEMLLRVGFAPTTPERSGLSLVDQLLKRGPVQARWTVPGNPHAARPLVELTGGFSQDEAVQAAVRAATNSEPVVAEFPAHAAAYGAAVLGVRAGSRLIGARR